MIRRIAAAGLLATAVIAAGAGSGAGAATATPTAPATATATATATAGRSCRKIYQHPPSGKRALAFRDVRAIGVNCRVADAVLLRWLRTPDRVQQFPPPPKSPKSLKFTGTTRGGWHCVEYFAHYTTPLGDAATTCTRAGKTIKGSYVP